MFNCFKNTALRLKNKGISDNDITPLKPKKDKILLVIIVVFALVAVLNFASGFGKTQSGESERKTYVATMPSFKFGVFDGVVLVGLVGGYVFVKIKSKQIPLNAEEKGVRKCIN